MTLTLNGLLGWSIQTSESFFDEVVLNQRPNAVHAKSRYVYM